ncbi:hypothetical protein [Variovorax sp. UMC13]|uniref:hypothetical protein n=1 Tax=Variovorax sp. UMC13 TaxID=1862326 RepID=UPI0016040891|nr:hypothetical protein [Variovorax sp. UMC13]MBB1601589.1 hypothetical protein [Variovorax sp. UMC13]
MQQIIGLEKPIEDPGTGGMASYHVVVQHLVQLRTRTSAVTLAGFVSQAAAEAGKQPLMHITAQIKDAPTGDSAAWPDWFCRQILNAETGGTNVLADAVPVYAAEPAAVAEEPAQ